MEEFTGLDTTERVLGGIDRMKKHKHKTVPTLFSSCLAVLVENVERMSPDVHVVRDEVPVSCAKGCCFFAVGCPLCKDDLVLRTSWTHSSQQVYSSVYMAHKTINPALLLDLSQEPPKKGGETSLERQPKKFPNFW